MIETIATDQAPAAIGPYSQAVRCDNFLFVSGQIGLDPRSGEFVSGDFEAQALQSFKNLQAIVEAAGTELRYTLKLNVSVVDMEQVQYFNGVMTQFFETPYPARALVCVAELPKGALVEVEAVVSIAG